MEKNGKSKNFLEQFEVIIGHAVRRPYRRFMRGRFELLRKQDEKLWRAAAWIYKKKPDQAGDFEKALLVGLTAGEFFSDWLASKTGMIGQIIARGAQEIMEDTPAVFRDYFSELPDDVFPSDYTGPKAEDFNVLGERFNAFLKESVSVFRNWISGGFVTDFLEFNQGVIVAKATTRLGPDAMIEFSDWWDPLPAHLKHEYRQALKAINDSGEMGLFLLLDSDQRHRFLRSVNSMGELQFPLTRRQRRQLAALWKKFFEMPLEEMTEWLRKENLKLDPKYKDQPNWKVGHFSPANLKKYPHRHDMLPVDDPRREAYERRKTINGRIRTGLLIVAAIIGYIMMSGSAQTFWASIKPYLGWIAVTIMFAVITVGFQIHRQG